MKKLLILFLSVILLTACTGEKDGDERGQKETNTEQSDSGEDVVVDDKDAEDAENNETKDQQLTEEEAKEVAKNYETTLVEIYNSSVDNFRIPGFQSIEDLVTHLNRVMHKEEANEVIDLRFKEENGDVYFLPMDAPQYFDDQLPYEFREKSKSEYELIQEQNSDFHGHNRITYTLFNEEGTWKVKDIVSEEVK
ncbi:hypothetical protein LS684_19035 [Cytobacillus spongiae]|uniref:hypothetical protein n=1 Tax=Cytobacillus spongiae TaxID=2901381 RepID=UPI001F259D0B|nr:hypothetical protein [Cytobacillus spongiae]UII55695.1 hypothetical protein LS684_19035 [Cytobacillus spongiae]